MVLRDSALIVVGHGSTVNPDSSTPTRIHTARIRKCNIFREVVCCFWKEEPSMREVYHMLDSKEIFVVPNFISEGYFTKTVIPRELELDGVLTRRGGLCIRYCPPAGSHPKMTDLLLRQASKIAAGVPRAQTSLIIVGHGTRLDNNSAVAVRKQVSCISAAGFYPQVIPAYMEEPPLVSEWDELSKYPFVVVIPFFVSDGLHSYQDIPALLGITSKTATKAGQAEVFWSNPHTLRGRKLFYGSSIGTEPLFADVIVDQAVQWNPSWWQDVQF
ncbi:MAG: cobalamin biosynthesis protein CbiX [Candidatus Xiphinematobacter sp.]|nr:MAG: cobalamin biosynthesis protein CbiX [Candidatus Xiphinematobacter sp.]QQY09931.1 MAG: cobalamin biosynthesis protein CbiX [Candidatus Xiphinematobacter sp.]QQY10666.1 MAG: cobalamin biosynthesis protein CbiX [Candidatus Xiphinematobacter sp.]